MSGVLLSQLTALFMETCDRGFGSVTHTQYSLSIWDTLRNPKQADGVPLLLSSLASQGSGPATILGLGRNWNLPWLGPRGINSLWVPPGEPCLGGQLEGSRRTSAPGRRPSAAMSGRSVPHAHPATAEYEFANPSRLGEQRFGEGLLPEEILTPTLYHGYYVRPRATRAGEGSRAGASELRLSEGKFQAFLDVSHFTPDEVTVRTVDNLLEVSARHPQRLDRHGFVSREFCRTYVLPADVDPWRVRAALSHDGILNLEAPRGGRHLDTEVNEVYISLLPPPPDPEEEEGETAGAEP